MAALRDGIERLGSAISAIYGTNEDGERLKQDVKKDTAQIIGRAAGGCANPRPSFGVLPRRRWTDPLEFGAATMSAIPTPT